MSPFQHMGFRGMAFMSGFPSVILTVITFKSFQGNPPMVGLEGCG